MNKMVFSQNKEKGIPSKNWIYLGVGLVIFGLAAINIVITLFWLRPFIKDLRERLINYELSEARRITETIERFTEKEIKDIENLCREITITGTKSEGAEFFIDQFLKGNPAAKELSVINLGGEEENRYSRGRLFTEKDLENFILSAEFKEARNGKKYISQVNFTDYAEPYVIIAMPLRKLEIEKPLAVLRVVLHLREAWTTVLEMKIGETGRVSVIDNKGMLIADPNPSRVLRKINLLDLPPAKPVLSGGIVKDEKYLNEKGVAVIGVGVPIKTLGWGVIIEQDVAELEAPVKKITSLAILFFSAGILITIILIWLLLVLKKADRTLLERYSALEKSQKELEDAKATLEIKVEARTRELKELAESLDEQVKEKTKKLQQKIDELERFHKLAVGRELKMIELKEILKKRKTKD